LEGRARTLLNPRWQGAWIERARQRIEFRLDRSGVAVASESNIAVGAIPTDFALTGPFLIVVTRRGAANPFFVMWVDNSELLCKGDG
jgi:hypothetical protein